MGSISFGSGRGRKTLAEAERRRSIVERRKVFGANRGETSERGKFSRRPAGKHCPNHISLLILKFNFVFTKVTNQALRFGCEEGFSRSLMDRTG